MTKEWAARLAAATGCDNPNDLMDCLQERGLVSDNCVTIQDVADTDAGKAYIKLLHEAH